MNAGGAPIFQWPPIIHLLVSGTIHFPSAAHTDGPIRLTSLTIILSAVADKLGEQGETSVAAPLSCFSREIHFFTMPRTVSWNGQTLSALLLFGMCERQILISVSPALYELAMTCIGCYHFPAILWVLWLHLATIRDNTRRPYSLPRRPTDVLNSGTPSTRPGEGTTNAR